MLNTKDVPGFTLPLAAVFDQWYLASLSVPQGLAAADLARLLPTGTQVSGCFDQVEGALAAALTISSPLDRIVVLGSFHTVAAGMRAAAGAALG